MDLRDYVTRADFCETLGISSGTLYVWLRKGLLKSYQYQKKRYFRKEDLERLLAERNTIRELAPNEFVRSK